MNKMPLIALVGMLSLSSAVAAEEEFSYTAKVGADMWWGSTKLNEVRQDEDSNSPSVYFAFEHNALCCQMLASVIRLLIRMRWLLISTTTRFTTLC